MPDRENSRSTDAHEPPETHVIQSKSEGGDPQVIKVGSSFPGDEEKSKGKRLRFRVTKAEKKTVEEKASLTHHTLSEYLRRASLNKPLRMQVDVETLAALRGIASQVREALNEVTGDDPGSELRQLLQGVVDEANAQARRLSNLMRENIREGEQETASENEKERG